MTKPSVRDLKSWNKADAFRFKKLIAGNGAADFLTVTEGAGSAVKKAPVKHRGTLKVAWPHLEQANRDGNAVFMMVNTGDGAGTKDINTQKINAVFVDSDGGKWGVISTEKLLLKFKLRPQIIVTTSPGNYHVYWLVSDLPVQMFDEIQKDLSRLFDSDSKVCNPARFMRLPGTWNLKKRSDPFLVKILHCDGRLKPYALDELVAGLGLQLNGSLSSSETAVDVTVVDGSAIQVINEPSINQILQWLSNINPDDRGIWMRVGMALKALRGDEGKPIYLIWSSSSSKYDQAEAERQWASFKPDGGITWATLRYLGSQGEGTEMRWSRGLENMHDFVATMVQDLGQRLKYSPNDEKWYAFTSGIWRRQSAYAEGVVLQYLREFLRNNPRHPLSGKLSGHNGLVEVMKLARSDQHCHVDPKEFDAHHGLVGVEVIDPTGGKGFAALDLTNGELRPAEPRDYLTKTMGVPFAPGAQCPLFVHFIKQIANGDEELAEALQVALGYTTFGHVNDQVMFVLIGSGSNGKAVLLNTFLHVFGGYAASVGYALLKKHNSNPNAPSPALAPLVGARFVQSSEFGDGERLEESLVKNITGSDPISYRPPYGDQAVFMPQCKIFLATNFFPKISFDHDAMWRRIFPVHLKRQFVGDECNPDLMDQLKAEGSGILNWLIEGAVKYHQRGKLLWPKSSLKYLESLKRDADTVGTWIKECCRRIDEGMAPASEAYASYKQFAKNNNQSAVGVKEFKKLMLKKGYHAKRTSTANVYVGLNIKG